LFGLGGNVHVIIGIEDLSVKNKFAEEPILVLEKGEYLSINKKVAFLLMLTLLLLGITTSTINIKPVKSSPTATIYFDPPSYNLNAAEVSVGYKFNATIKVSDVENLDAWQVCMYYNTTILRVSRYFEPSWDPEYVFYGKSTLFLKSKYHDFLVAALLYPWPQEPFYGSGKLCIIEFEVLQVPPIGETYSSILNIDNDETFLVDPDINDIPAVKENGYYLMAWLIHDVVISLDAPTFFNVDSPILLNATVWNFGLSNEANVEVYLLINGTVVSYVVIQELLSGHLYSLSHLWAPRFGVVYNITAYVLPVPGENITMNNLVTKFIKWTGTIYIRPDGSISPPNVPIISYDNVNYILTGNITSTADGIVVERDNIIIDGACYTLRGPGIHCYYFNGIPYYFKGINISGRYNVTINNTNIENFYYGIYLYYSSNSTIVGNIVSNTSGGIFLEDSSNNNIISGNSIANNRYDGIHLSSSSNNVISENSITNNGVGICLGSSLNNSITGNNITSNTPHGIYLYGSSSNSIAWNNITSNYYGIYLEGSSNNFIAENSITNNRYDGIHLERGSSNNIMSRNNIANGYGGIAFWVLQTIA
jgi:parallel beta-helix repeat protein